MNSLIYDIVVLAILLLFAFWGLHRGLVRTLCSLVAVLIAFGGATVAANLLAPAVAGLLEPPLTSAIEARLEEAIQHTQYISPGGGVAQRPEEVALTGVLDVLEDMGLHGSLVDSIRDTVESGVAGAASSAAAQVGAAAARSLAFLLSYSISFAVIMILWRILSRALNLMARLPVLRTLNKAGGFVLGVLCGVVVLFVCAWLLRWFGGALFPPEAVEQTYVFRFFMMSNPLSLLEKL